jgi:heat shock protein HslJ
MEFTNFKRLFLSLILWFTVSGFAQTDTIKTWIIADTKISCQVADYTMACYKYKLHKDSNWMNFSYEIEGFAYEQGNEYVIEVNEEKLKFPELNGPQYKWTLVRIVSTTKTIITDKRVLLNNKWNLINMSQGAKIQLARKAKAFIAFDVADNKINAFSGCNTMNGNSAISDGFIEFGNIISTMMACDSFKMVIESKLNESLKGKAVYYVRNNMLFISCENNITLELRPEKRLDSIIEVIQTENAKIKENTLINLGDNNYTLLLINKDNKEPIVENLVGNSITPTQKKTILAKLTPIAPISKLKTVILTKKETGVKGNYIALLEYNDGSKKEIIVILK